jgi:hypothetical protein
LLKKKEVVVVVQFKECFCSKKVIRISLLSILYNNEEGFPSSPARMTLKESCKRGIAQFII